MFVYYSVGKNENKENKMKRRNDMKLSEVVFDTDHCDESGSLNLVNEFFETNNEPTTNGREYKGWRGVSDGTVDPCRVSPYTFGLREQSDVDPYDPCNDDNKLLGWPTDNKKYREGGNGTGWTRRGSDENY
tara:strand:+ start:413 stop:805 length:393 start_codon:yes stop_codon:yes gene_type:complete